jgi:hypothetical protein
LSGSGRGIIIIHHRKIKPEGTQYFAPGGKHFVFVARPYPAGSVRCIARFDMYIYQGELPIFVVI